MGWFMEKDFYKRHPLVFCSLLYYDRKQVNTCSTREKLDWLKDESPQSILPLKLKCSQAACWLLAAHHETFAPGEKRRTSNFIFLNPNHHFLFAHLP